MLVPETGVYLSTVPLLELEKGLYIGPGIACLDIELDDVDSGDVEANVDGARKLGIDGILFINIPKLIEDLNERGIEVN